MKKMKKMVTGIIDNIERETYEKRAGYCDWFLCGAFSVGLCLSMPASAGKLDDFEQATKKKKSRASANTVYDDKDSRDGFFAEFFSDIFSDLLRAVLYEGGRNSQEYAAFQMNALNGGSRSGNALLPFVRFDGDYVDVESDVASRHYALAAGYGAWAVTLEQHELWEDDPDDILRFQTVMGLYRMSFGRSFALGLGLGQTRISGDDDDRGFAMSISMMGRINHQLQWEFTPAWHHHFAQTREALDLGLLWHTNQALGLKLGYRSQQVQSESLRGPYLGITFFF